MSPALGNNPQHRLSGESTSLMQAEKPGPIAALLCTVRSLRRWIRAGTPR